MNNYKDPQGTGSKISGKIRFSLVFKLNLRMLGMLVSSFISFNILLILVFLGITLWRAEEGAKQIIQTYGISAMLTADPVVALSGYDVTILDNGEEGLLFPLFVQNKLPLAFPAARRQISLPGANAPKNLLHRIEAVTYQMILTTDGRTYQLSYALGSDLRFFFYLMLVILGSQLLFLLRRISTNIRAIRQTLKPLTEMAETARNLQQDIGSMRTAPSGVGIQHLAGAINTINAEQLNRQLSIDSSQEELKDLAYAINGMLHRINRAYQSQVRFVSDASHELRTPISVIQGYANLLDRWGKHDAKTMQEAIDAIKSETENMKALVEQLLFLARGDNDTIHLEKTVFDSCKMVAEIVREARLIDPAHHYETTLNGPAYIEADQQLIKQALRILVDNSIKYTPPTETIRLKVAVEKDTVQIQVQDSGIGIAPEDVARVFDRFYRSDESRARKTGGSGLGLAIAKWIIDHHDGHYEVLSRVDIGTRITLNLPLATKPVTTTENPD
jgi:signal transduction histidine kinase